MMFKNGVLLMGAGERQVNLLPSLANRHGLIAGATGTGKTVTLKVMAESFSQAGVPVFLADIKGDVSGMAAAGENTEKMRARAAKLGAGDYNFRGCPVKFWDVYGENGHPVRTTVSEMGPFLLSRILGLTAVQQGVLNIVFRIADDSRLLLIDMKDLRAMLRYVGENSAKYTTEYGNVSKQSVGAILRALLELEDAGGDVFFGEPALDIFDWLKTDTNGQGCVNILHAARLFLQPLLYSTFMMWMLTELYENLPEVGDLEQPKIAFFFDEAHLLFADAPKALVQKIEQIVKLVRSKGVGVYFITQNPMDLPEQVLAQLGNRVQHALRAYTPAEQKAVRSAARSFRPNPAFDTEAAITELSTGEALVSFLDENGAPSVVERAKILPPMCLMGALGGADRRRVINSSELYGKYERAIDRISAYETLSELEKREAREAEERAEREKWEKERAKEAAKRSRAASSGKSSSQSLLYKAASSTANTVGREVGKSIIRGLFGSMRR